MKNALRKRLDANVKEFEKKAMRYLRAPYASSSALHDLRVALRNLRAGTRVLSQVDDRGRLRGLVTELRTLSRTTSAARDAQVLQQILRGPAFSFWTKKSSVQRRRATEAVLKRLRCQKPMVFAEKIRREIAKQIDQTSGSAIIHAACKMAKKDERKLARDGSRIKEMVYDQAFLHQYRIRAKKLRYTIALFGPILSKRCRRLEPLTKHTQDALGKVHDLDRAIATITRIRGVSDRQKNLSRLRVRRQKAVEAALVDIKAMRKKL